MREVTSFVVMLPEPSQEGDVTQTAMRLAREFPHYTFEVVPNPHLTKGEQVVLPVIGAVGDIERAFICKPLDPRVIPQIEDVVSGFCRR